MAEAELQQAQIAVRDYDAAITAYTHCLADAEARLMALHPESAEALRIARADRNDAAVALAERLVGSFNDSLEVFRRRGVTGPRMSGPSRAKFGYCYPRSVHWGRVIVVLTISETGEVSHIEFPPALSSDVQAAVRCIIGKSSFTPGMRNGKPVSSIASVPIEFRGDSKKPSEPPASPVLSSRPEEIAIAHDKCLPAGLHAGGHVELALTVGRTGRVVAVRTAVSSGSKDVDRVAACVARTLKYTPGRLDGKVVEMHTVPWAIRIAPRSEDEPADTD